jgi:uncharacterized protein DUF6510
MSAEDRRLDGNAAAGLLAEIFAFDMTSAWTVCESCGGTAFLGALHAYTEAPGTVLRCVSCEAVQIRVVTDGQHRWFDLRGVRCLELASPGTIASPELGSRPPL